MTNTARVDISGRRGWIENEFVRVEVDGSQGLRLSHFTHKTTGTDWIPQPPDTPWGHELVHPALATTDPADIWPNLAPPSDEFALNYSLAESSESLDAIGSTVSAGPRAITVTGRDAGAWVEERSSAAVHGDTARLDVAVLLDGHPFEVTVHTELRAGLPVVRRWTTVRNVGDRPARFHRLSSLLLSVRPGPADLDLYWVENFIHPGVSKSASRWRQATVHQERLGPVICRTLKYGPYPRVQDGSHGCMAWAALRDPDLAEGLFVGWEWSGLFDLEVGDFQTGAGAFGLRAGFSDEGGYARVLEPGASFTTPVAFAGFFQGGVEEAGRATRKAAETLFGLPWPEGKPPMFVGYDTWCNWQDFKGNTLHLLPERLDREIEQAAALGVELFILDYDWFPLLGDFVTDTRRFPDGIESYSRKVKAAGMKFGLWMGFGQVHQDSIAAREHPDWLVTKNGRAVSGGWGMYAICLGYPPCRDWVFEQICRVVETFGVDWLKHDFDLLPVSDAHHHAPGATDSRLETVQGYYWIMEQLHRRFPKLYLDNWTPAQGGADFGNFQRHHSMLIGDWYTPTTDRSLLQGISHLFPVTRCHQYLRVFHPEDERSAYTYRSVCFGAGVYLLNDILQWDEPTRQAARRELDRFKADRDLFLDGEVFLLIAKQPDHFGWDARMVYSAARGRGMVQVFRNHDPRRELRVRLRGLEPDSSFVIESADGGQPVRLSGREGMDSGFSVRLEQPFSAALFRLHRA